MKSKLQFVFLLLISELFLISNVLGQTPTPPALGDGSSGNPYQIATLDNLYWLTASDAVVSSPTQATRWDANYIQISDIDASTTSGWSSGGWSPIGNNVTKFSGSYDGQGHIISSIYISRSSSDNQGLFGYTNTTTIQNLGLTSIVITGHDNVGGLVGYNHSSILKNCYITGSLMGNQLCGGIAGTNITSSSINGCYTDVDIQSNKLTGGFIGFNFSSAISDCYSLGEVQCLQEGVSETTLGSFCGKQSNSSSAKIEYCYSTGAVSYLAAANPTDKGFIGVNDNGDYTANFFDTETSGQSTGTGATAKTTTQMKTESTFSSAGWDGNIWYMDSGINNGYPYLSWENPSGTPVPVELTTFTSKAVGESIVLNWQTATEVNNYGFEVQRTDISSQISEREWETLGFIEGHGNSVSPKYYEFVDESPLADSAEYRLKQIDTDGGFEYYAERVQVAGYSTTDIDDETMKLDYKLAQNYSNPFNPTTQIAFTIPSEGIVKLNVYNVLGEVVFELVNQNLEAGLHEYEFNAGDLTSGIYFYSISINGFREVKKMNLVK